MDEKGWFREPARHSLASRGIRTRAIINPVASPEWYREYRYGPGKDSIKGLREYRGSGLENVDAQEIIGWILDYFILLNQIAEEDGDPLGLEIQSIYLVGSRVSGFYEEGSDIDVIVVFKGDGVVDDEYRSIIDMYIVDTTMAIDFDKEWLVKSGDDVIKVDVVYWGWEGPEEGSPQLKIWEAP